MAKERMFISIDKDIADMLKSLDRNRSKAINIVLRYAVEKGILQKVVHHLQGEENLLKELLEERPGQEKRPKEKANIKKRFSNLMEGIDD